MVPSIRDQIERVLLLITDVITFFPAVCHPLKTTMPIINMDIDQCYGKNDLPAEDALTRKRGHFLSLTNLKLFIIVIWISKRNLDNNFFGICILYPCYTEVYLKKITWQIFVFVFAIQNFWTLLTDQSQRDERFGVRKAWRITAELNDSQNLIIAAINCKSSN